MSRPWSNCVVATKKRLTPKRAHVTRYCCSRCEARPRVRSLKSCCVVKTRSCVFSNGSSPMAWMLFPDEPPLGERERSRSRGRAELLRVIELDPHEVGQDTANWTTERLARYLGQHTGIQVNE